MNSIKFDLQAQCGKCWLQVKALMLRFTYKTLTQNKIMRLIYKRNLPMTGRSVIGLAFVLGMLLIVPMGCSKDVLDKNDLAKKAEFQGMRDPEISSFMVESKSYHGNDLAKDHLNAMKRNDLFPSPIPNKESYVYKDGPGQTQLLNGSNYLYFQQKYKSRMFTIADQSMALNIYPGAILKGSSIEGVFDPKMLVGISQNIRPVTLSTSMPVSGSVVAKTTLPRPIAERALTNAALTDLETLNPGGVGAASLSLELDSFKVYEELKTMYGYNKSIDVFLVGANTTQKGENHYITSKSALKLKFFQENFTVDLDVPNSYNELFDPTGLDMPAITGGVTPVYVKSVTYGRMGIMVIESSYSSAQVYNAVYKQLGILLNIIGIDKNMTDQEKTIINTASIKVKYTGVNADADGMITVNGLAGFIAILSANKTYSKESPGVPVAFQLANLTSHAIIEAPFQINYGPWDRPFVKIVLENKKTIGVNPVYVNADLYAYFYTDQAGTIPYNDPPDFFPYPYDVTNSSVSLTNWAATYSKGTEHKSFVIKNAGYRRLMGTQERVSYYVKYGSQANSSRTDYTYQLVPNSFFFKTN